MKLPIPALMPFEQHHLNRSTIAGTVALANTTATSATTTTLTVSTASWTTNQYATMWILIVGGTGAGQAPRIIASNTSTALTVSVAFATTPDSTSVFKIITPAYPGLQGSLVPNTDGGFVLNTITYRELVKCGGSSTLTTRILTATAAGTLTVTPARLLAVVPTDEGIYQPSGAVDTTKVQKYTTGAITAAVTAGTEVLLTITLGGEAYCLVEFACTTSGTISYVDCSTLVNSGSGTGTVTGTVAVSNFPATQPVSGTVAVSNLPATQPVSGTISVGNFPATQPASIASGQVAAGALAAGSIATGAAVVGAFLDGAIATLGTNADGAVNGDNPGTASAKLRGLNKTIEDVHDATDHAINVNLVKDSTAAPTSPLLVQGTDQTQSFFEPPGDAAARAKYVIPSDGTRNATVKAASTPAATTDTALVVAVSPNNVLKIGDGTTGVVIKAASTEPLATDVALVTSNSPNSAPFEIWDGTNEATVKAASTPAATTDTAIVVAISPNNVVTLGGTTATNKPTLAVTASAYAANQCMGGKLTLTNALRVGGPLSGAFSKLQLRWHGSSPPALSMLLFSDNPAATFTDQVAFPTLSAADNALVSALITIATTDWTIIGGSSFCTKAPGALPVVGVAATLYAAFNVTSGTPTPAATTDLSASWGFFND